MLKLLQQRWQRWWSAIQHWIALPWRSASAARPAIAADENRVRSSKPPASALLILLASRPRRSDDTRHHCSTKISARAWQGERRVIDLLAYHAARHAGDLTPTQMQQRLNNIRAHTPD